jgi:threonine dehydrogenase-like Zn-dependent dehydrogenase
VSSVPGKSVTTIDALYRGILGGSRTDFEALNAFLGEKRVKMDPIIDRIFTFDEAPAAYQYLALGTHVGKVVIKVS